MNLPFVGAGVLGSAVGMDKDVMKRQLRDAGVPIAKFLVFPRALRNTIDSAAIAAELGLPYFVKPANLGSSVGVSRVNSDADFALAIDEAFRYDNKIIIEECIHGREIECSVLGNDDPIASLPGEVVTDAAHHTFYSYEAKYLDEHGAMLEIPANLPEHLIKRVQDTSVQAFQVLCCEGMARVDCFVTEDERVVVNEINTIPGFTRISMYPKLWEASGVPYPELINRLIQLALERHEREQHIATSVQFLDA
jgi:D-alanine-D-alanine ligase